MAEVRDVKTREVRSWLVKQGLTYAQIGAALGVRAGQVSMVLHNKRRRGWRAMQVKLHIAERGCPRKLLGLE